MTEIQNLEQAREDLVELLARHQVPTPEPIDVSPWIAMSLLQKAVRRSEERYALQSAATLLHQHPDRFWKRCAGIAFEDIGVANPALLAIVMAALDGKRFRASIGGEWAVASLVVSKLVHSAKCRAADDLLMLADRHPDFAQARKSFAVMPSSELFGIVDSGECLAERVIAAWYSAGAFWRTSTGLTPRRGSAATLFQHLARDCSSSAVELARRGYARGAGMLSLCFLLLLHERRHDGDRLLDDKFPPAQTIGNIPGWSLDLYSQEGRASLNSFCNSRCKTSEWLHSHVRVNRLGTLGGLLFRVEGGLVSRRLIWDQAESLRRAMDFEAHGLAPACAEEGLSLLSSEIDLLNIVRQQSA